MKVIGVTGGIGSGKSTVVNLAKEYFPVEIIQTDDVAREQMKSSGCSFARVVEAFGDQILGEDGEIDRARLAKIVFSKDENVKKINSITHPNVRVQTLEMIENYRKNPAVKAVLVETALLFEAAFDVFCDETWCVWASEETRRERLLHSRGYSNEKIDAIFSKQDKEEYAKEHCTHVIINEKDESKEELLKTLKKILE